MMEKLNTRKGKSGLPSLPLKKAASWLGFKGLRIIPKDLLLHSDTASPPGSLIPNHCISNTALFQGGAMAVLGERSLPFHGSLAK